MFDYTLLINGNIRCFEMLITDFTINIDNEINGNIRCFEIKVLEI